MSKYPNRPEMESPEYKSWRMAVFKMWGWKCAKCGSNKQIQSHHISRWADAIHLRYAVHNGICLCKICHDMVTGHEEQYENEFIRMVAEKKVEEQSRRGFSKGKKTGGYKPPYILKNPWSRYG